MWFITKIKNNRDLLILKVYGYSNLKIFIILALTSPFGLDDFSNYKSNNLFNGNVLRKTKSQYSRDIDHLISFNKNGLWIKENLETGNRIITAEKPEKFDLINVSIFNLIMITNLKQKFSQKK